MTRLGICVLAAAAFAAGCGGVGVNDLKQDEVNAICDRLVRCGVFASKDLCIAAYNQFFNDDQLKAGVANGSIKYDDGKAGDCIDAIDNQSCDVSQQDNRVEPAACKSTVKGNRKQGDPCYFNLQCTSNSCQQPTGTCTMACCAGTCNADPPAAVAIGQSCTMAPCVDGAYCDATTTCAALLASGATCAADNQCAYGTVCAGATTRTCTAAPKVGDACLMKGSAPTCVSTGLRCDATTHCVALLGAGAACDPQQSLCKNDFVCDATAHTCNALPGDGQACTQACAPPDRCVIDQTTQKGTCKPLANVGEACTSNFDCASQSCDTATTMKCLDKVVCS